MALADISKWDNIDNIDYKYKVLSVSVTVFWK